ncbi:MAG TPA: methyltransferase [Microbacteriaceae bacterium]|nr:methyltransferase [Microbacteriaceae bacterium]HQX35845.1 methyltransferase [Microbacteriaceae bacterium]HQZ48536.1 methyltransferase [Microbacteriaceae bacterium]HRA08694.1 methyltransferase [Microbacteriaceae bacterium]
MSSPFALGALRRYPDIEAPELTAVDAADRLILDESAAMRAEAATGAGDLVVIGDDYGALTLSAAAEGARGIRVHQDPLLGERALARNATEFGLDGTFTSLPLGAELVRGARVVLLRLPRSLEALDDIAALLAAHAAPDVVVVAGGRIKHMTVAMNDVLARHFSRVDVTHARQKSRVLIARAPQGGGHDPVAACRTHALPGEMVDPGTGTGTGTGTGSITVCAFGGAFAGASIDIGTRFLLENLPARIDAGTGPAIDFACGTGVVGSWLALRHPELQVYASDQSAVAVASAGATAQANGVADRVRVVRDDGLSLRADASASFIALNPPFHTGATVHTGLAGRLFAEAARVLEPGGELWTVWNSHLAYRSQLERIVGPTRQVARGAKFTVTVSTRR